MNLYGSYTSPFVRHCRIALAQGGIGYEFVDTDYAQSAEMSPAQKVPFLKDGDLMLTDSSSILKYVREQSGKAFFEDLQDFELFTLVNTLLDSTINLFLLERSGVDLNTIPYLERQASRINTGLAALNRLVDPEKAMLLDSHIRCACYVDWAVYRKRLEFSEYDNLLALVAKANKDDIYQQSAPPVQ